VSALATLKTAVGSVCDPEIQVLTIAELGVLRHVSLDDGRPTVTITPTYVGCPAMDVIREDIADAARTAGFDDIAIVTVWSPAWTTDWLDESARSKLAAARIAPPAQRPRESVLLQIGTARSAGVQCPSCGSAETHETSRFGSTACKSLWTCAGCGDPFDHLKAH